MSEVSLLLRRSGFGTTGAEVAAATARGYEATVEALLTPGADPGAVPPPELGVEPARPPKADDKAARRTYTRQLRTRSETLALWWLDRMVRVQQPLVERLTVTWHGHWATSIQKVRSPAMMLAQNETLRAKGRGDFRELARAMVRDPALLVWLDGQRNKKGKPNENLARELMELFTLGVGHYSETDVREAARALTGWTVDRAHATAAPVPKQHDDGSKTVLGVTGDLDDRGLVDLLTARPESAAFVATRLWSRLGSSTLPADTLARLVAAYGPNRDVTALLRALYLDPAFRADKSSLVAAPVEYVVGVFRALRLEVPREGKPGRGLLATLDALGQVPFRPPSVGGWPGGVAWLSTAATRERLTFATAMAKKADLGAVSSASDRPAAAAHLLGVDAWTPRTLAALKDAAAEPARLVTLALISPEYLVR
ncbi:MAG TPA: DUF1800 domain-containing protein [Mycobacteriales bacterium]|nr:DUF1800 domain-containing protein [Mycobacteriales bacterium]